jgi:hypothetical protein
MNPNSDLHEKWLYTRWPWLLSGFGSLVALVALLRIPGEGLSPQRLMLVGVLVLGGLVGFSGAFFNGSKYFVWANWLWSRRWLDGLIVLAVALGWLGLFLPDYWFGTGMAYAQRLRPLVLWLGWAGLLAAIIRFRLQQALGSVWAALRAEPPHFWRGVGVSLAVFALIAALGLSIGLGVKPDDRFWNEAGAPVLGVQVLIGLIFAWGVGRLARRRSAWSGWAIGLALWLMAVVVWNAQPMLSSYFAPGPYPPSNRFYPYSDAAVYDVGAQYVLLGRGILNNQYMDKPFYVAMLAGFRAVAGQRYDAVIGVQTLLLALLPVALFAIGKSLRGPELGTLLGVLVIFKERNAIAATLDIQVSHSKLMMAEMPVALALAGLTWAGVCWLRQPQHGKRWAIVCAALAGAAVLIRPNAILAVAALVGLWLVARWRSDGWRRSLVQLSLFAGVFAICFFPWMMNIPTGMNQPYLVLKLRQIIETRYQPSTSGNGHNNNLVVAPLKKHFDESRQGLLRNNQTNFVFVENQQGLAWALVNHWLHNEWLTVLSLPNTLALQDLSHTLQAPYWQDVRSWDGKLGLEQTLLTWFNLGLLALGVGEAWRRWHWAGVLPLTMQVGYFAANGLARNSGARYLVPVDWVTLIYYGLGLVMLLGWLAAHWRIESDSVVTDGPVVFAKGRLIFAAALMLICASLPLWDDLVPDRYASSVDRQALWQKLQQNGLLIAAGLNTDEGRSYFFDEALVLEGRALYPRFYYHDQGEPVSKSSGTSPLGMFYPRPYPRLTWILLSNDFYRFVLLPMSVPPSDELPDASDVIVLACPGEKWFAVDAQAVFVLGPTPQVLLRSPQAALHCPLPEPVCDLNRNCR